MTLQPEPPTHTDMLIVVLGGLLVLGVILGFTLAFLVTRWLDRRDRQRLAALARRWDDDSVELLSNTAPTWRERGENRVADITKGRGYQLDDCARELLDALEEK